VFRPVRTRRTFEEAAEQIADGVRNGQLRVGDRLPGERALAAQMEISRPTLREAIKVLVTAGVLEVRRGADAGMFVATDVVPTDLVRETSDLRLSEVASVLEARRLVEPGVVRLASQRAGAEDLEALERSIESMRRIVAAGSAPGDEDRFLQLDVQFHLALARATGNPTIERQMRMLFRELEIARDMAMHEPLVPEWTIAVHEETLRAIADGDEATIADVMDRHLGRMENTWREEAGQPS
jgi:GntR family transcriptional repressor for pyruvate dehydrogenase complex